MTAQSTSLIYSSGLNAYKRAYKKNIRRMFNDQFVNYLNESSQDLLPSAFHDWPIKVANVRGYATAHCSQSIANGKSIASRRLWSTVEHCSIGINNAV